LGIYVDSGISKLKIVQITIKRRDIKSNLGFQFTLEGFIEYLQIWQKIVGNYLHKTYGLTALADEVLTDWACEASILHGCGDNINSIKNQTV
jgi:hypothetical protein